MWAIGCAWAHNVERQITKARPLLTCTLLLLGLYVTTHFLLEHLSWYGFAPRPAFYVHDASRAFIRLAVFAALTILVCVVTPGEPRRKVFAAVAFPLFAMVTLAASRAAFEVAHTLTAIIGPSGIEATIRIALVGTIVAAIVSLPFALVYRRSAAALASLALMPPLARYLGQARPPIHTLPDILAETAPFTCSLLLITIFSSTCYQWIRRSPFQPRASNR